MMLLPLVVGVATGSSVTVGSIRVSALSKTLIRIEPKGPRGFEDRDTFVAAARSSFGDGVPLTTLNTSNNGTWLATDDVHIFVPPNLDPTRACAANLQADALNPQRSSFYPNGTHAISVTGCCDSCLGASDCKSWVFAPDFGEINCWPLRSAHGPNLHPKHKDTRVFGQIEEDSPIIVASASDGATIWPPPHSTTASNILHWPSPLTSKAYALIDSPRFTVPEWGPTPIPRGAKLDPALEPTNGYDFRNNVSGDTYIFVLGADLSGWYHSRSEFLKLSGPTPLLPDWAYGAWYTWYIPYTEAEAKEEVGNWTRGKVVLLYIYINFHHAAISYIDLLLLSVSP